MTTPQTLRQSAETEAARLPPLLAAAHHLAGTVLLGEHGRRRPGQGDDFWQYRAVQPGDSRRWIDWRRSARSDTAFVKQREWKIAQTVNFWVDGSASMRFSSDKEFPEKHARAGVLALALAIVLERGGERIGLSRAELPARRGVQQVERMAAALIRPDADEFGHPGQAELPRHSRAVFLSDFFGDFEALTETLTRAADRGVEGVLLQVLDPAEESFPFRARTIFESPSGSYQHETLKAAGLREKYLDRLAARKDALAALAARTGWRWSEHHTSEGAQMALMWLYRNLQSTERLR